ncbi:MAG: hypothetical protein FJ278_01325 [Planctomycetes bacterium]|nr:hypothetical protein [Planctomycetota bacterium]
MSRARGTREFFEVHSPGQQTPAPAKQEAAPAAALKEKKRRFVGVVDAEKGDFVPTSTPPPTATVVPEPAAPQEIFPFANTKPKKNFLQGTEISFKIDQEKLVIAGLVVCAVLVATVVAAYRAGTHRGGKASQRLERLEAAKAATLRVETPALAPEPSTPAPAAAKPAPAALGPEHTPAAEPVVKPEPVVAAAPAKPAAAPAPASTQGKWTIRLISYQERDTAKADALASALRALLGNTDVIVRKMGRDMTVCAGLFDSKSSDGLKELQNKLATMKYGGKLQFKDCYPVVLQ